MNIGKACAIFEQIDSNKYTDAEKLEAVREVVEMPTHNGITKDKMFAVLRWFAENTEPDTGVPRWIPVTDRLPEPDEIVLAYCPCRKRMPSEIQTMRGWAAMIHATHWMSMPEPPEVET